MLHNLHIFILLFSFSLFGEPAVQARKAARPPQAQAQAQDVISVRPWFDNDPDDHWSLGTVVVKRKGRKGNEEAAYMVTDRKLDELKSQYGELLNPEELQGKRVLDLGTGGGSMVTSIRHYGKTLCRQGSQMLAEASSLEKEGETMSAQGAGMETTGKALIAAGEKVLEQSMLGIPGEKVGTFLCGMGDSFCKEGMNFKEQGQGLCSLAASDRKEGEAKIKKGESTKGSFADMHGIDIALPPHLKALRDENGKPFFVQGDASKTPYKDQEFDKLFSSWSIFIYEGANRDLMNRTFRESNRILKTGGTLTISPVLDLHWRKMSDLIKMAGFEVSRTVKQKHRGFDPTNPRVGGTFYNIELKKVGPVLAQPTVAQKRK
jgi:ubiquinone/menaquinone biosynthesis C-methylase UbiE